jgi:uncharacterized protein YndB with AHSA1/START domain
MDTVIIEQTLQANVKRVWRALTDKEELRQWFFVVTDFKPQTGFEFDFPGEGHTGAIFTHLCKVLEVIPFKKIQYSWQYSGVKGYSTVAFELFAENETETRLRLFHDGIDTFPQDDYDFSSESFGAGWTEIVTRMLPAYLHNAK